MLRELGELHRNPAALGAMRAASSGLGRPGAAAAVAALLASLANTRAGLIDMKAARHA